VQTICISCLGQEKEHVLTLSSKGLAMFVKIKTYRDEELYLILKETLDMFYDAYGKLDFKNIGEKNNITNTVWALSMLSFRLRWLCESILSCIDYYSVAIIYRAYIDHNGLYVGRHSLVRLSRSADRLEK